MSDEVQATVQQPVARKDHPIGGPNKPGNRGGKRATTPRNVAVSGSKPDTQRPSSRASNPNKKESAQQPAGNKQKSGGNNNNGGARGGRRPSASNQRAQRSASGAGQQTSNDSSPADDSAGALANLNRLVLEMKGLGGTNDSSSENNTPNSSAPNLNMAASAQQSKLPADAPVFQPGAGSFPGLAGRDVPPRHAKAASLGGAPAPQMGYSSSYSPNLGAMNEDLDDGAYEEGEIAESPYAQGMHARSQSQGFTAPRFAALARENQSEQLGPSGRPQLAPSFTFGARRRGTNPVAIAPAISEEDANFQFPQQQQQQESLSPPTEHRRSGSNGEITGIMAEQVSCSF